MTLGIIRPMRQKFQGRRRRRQLMRIKLGLGSRRNNELSNNDDNIDIGGTSSRRLPPLRTERSVGTTAATRNDQGCANRQSNTKRTTIDGGNPIPTVSAPAVDDRCDYSFSSNSIVQSSPHCSSDEENSGDDDSEATDYLLPPPPLPTKRPSSSATTVTTASSDGTRPKRRTIPVTSALGNLFPKKQSIMSPHNSVTTDTSQMAVNGDENDGKNINKIKKGDDEYKPEYHPLKEVGSVASSLDAASETDPYDEHDDDQHSLSQQCWNGILDICYLYPEHHEDGSCQHVTVKESGSISSASLQTVQHRISSHGNEAYRSQQLNPKRTMMGPYPKQDLRDELVSYPPTSAKVKEEVADKEAVKKTAAAPTSGATKTSATTTARQQGHARALPPPRRDTPNVVFPPEEDEEEETNLRRSMPPRPKRALSAPNQLQQQRHHERGGRGAQLVLDDEDELTPMPPPTLVNTTRQLTKIHPAFLGIHDPHPSKVNRNESCLGVQMSHPIWMEREKTNTVWRNVPFEPLDDELTTPPSPIVVETMSTDVSAWDNATSSSDWDHEPLIVRPPQKKTVLSSSSKTNIKANPVKVQQKMTKRSDKHVNNDDKKTVNPMSYPMSLDTKSSPTMAKPSTATHRSKTYPPPTREIAIPPRRPNFSFYPRKETNSVEKPSNRENKKTEPSPMREINLNHHNPPPLPKVPKAATNDKENTVSPLPPAPPPSPFVLPKVQVKNRKTPLDSSILHLGGKYSIENSDEEDDDYEAPFDEIAIDLKQSLTFDEDDNEKVCMISRFSSTPCTSSAIPSPYYWDDDEVSSLDGGRGSNQQNDGRRKTDDVENVVAGTTATTTATGSGCGWVNFY